MHERARGAGQLVWAAALALSISAPAVGDGLPNEYALTQRWRELFMMNSPLANPAYLCEADYIGVRGALAPVLQGSFMLWELGVTVPIGMYHSAGFTVVGENPGEVIVGEADAEGRLVDSGERAEDKKRLFVFSYATNPWRRLNVGANLSLAYESNFGDDVMGLGLDLGLSWRLIKHPLVGEHVLGLSTQNLLAPAMSSAPVPTFSEEGAYSRGLKISWNAKLLDGRIESGLDFDIKDFLAASEEFQKLDQTNGNLIDAAKEIEWGLSWRIGVWFLRIIKLYGQFGFDADGLEYWGLAGGINVPTVNRGRDLSVLYQYNRKVEADDASTHTFYAWADLGRHREEVYAKRFARLLNLSPNDLYNRALALYHKGKYWDAFFMFGQLQVTFPDFFKMDWVDYYMGSCQEWLDMRESAGNRYRAVTHKYPASAASSYAALGQMRLHFREADFEGVRGQYEVLARPEVPDSLRHHAEYLWGQALANSGRYQEALEPLLAVPYTHPEYVFARHSLALAYMRIGDESDAMRNLEEVVLARPRTPEQKEIQHRTYALLGYIFYEQQSLSKAVSALRMIPAESYYYPDALLGLGWCALKAQQWEDCADIGRKLRQNSERPVVQAEGVIIESYGYIRQKRMIEAAALLSSAYETVQTMTGPGLDTLRVRAEANRMDRVVYDSLAEETNRQALMEFTPASVPAVDRMHTRQLGLERPLRTYLVFKDEYFRDGYFARAISKVREDIEYMYVFVRKKAGEEKGIQQALEVLRKQQSIDADIDRLKRELETIEKQQKSEPKKDSGRSEPIQDAPAPAPQPSPGQQPGATTDLPSGG